MRTELEGGEGGELDGGGGGGGRAKRPREGRVPPFLFACTRSFCNHANKNCLNLLFYANKGLIPLRDQQLFSL